MILIILIQLISSNIIQIVPYCDQKCKNTLLLSKYIAEHMNRPINSNSTLPFILSYDHNTSPTHLNLTPNEHITGNNTKVFTNTTGSYYNSKDIKKPYSTGNTTKGSYITYNTSNATKGSYTPYNTSNATKGSYTPYNTVNATKGSYNHYITGNTTKGSYIPNNTTNANKGSYNQYDTQVPYTYYNTTNNTKVPYYRPYSPNNKETLKILKINSSPGVNTIPIISNELSFKIKPFNDKEKKYVIKGSKFIFDRNSTNSNSNSPHMKTLQSKLTNFLSRSDLPYYSTEIKVLSNKIDTLYNIISHLSEIKKVDDNASSIMRIGSLKGVSDKGTGVKVFSDRGSGVKSVNNNTIPFKGVIDKSIKQNGVINNTRNTKGVSNKNINNTPLPLYTPFKYGSLYFLPFQAYNTPLEYNGVINKNIDLNYNQFLNYPYNSNSDSTSYVNTTPYNYPYFPYLYNTPLYNNPYRYSNLNTNPSYNSIAPSYAITSYKTENSPYANTSYNTANPPYVNTSYNSISPPYANTSYNTINPPYANTYYNSISPSYANTSYNTVTPRYANTYYNSISPPYANTSYNTVNPPYVNTFYSKPNSAIAPYNNRTLSQPITHNNTIKTITKVKKINHTLTVEHPTTITVTNLKSKEVSATILSDSTYSDDGISDSNIISPVIPIDRFKDDNEESVSSDFSDGKEINTILNTTDNRKISTNHTLTLNTRINISPNPILTLNTRINKSINTINNTTTNHSKHYHRKKIRRVYKRKIPNTFNTLINTVLSTKTTDNNISAYNFNTNLPINTFTSIIISSSTVIKPSSKPLDTNSSVNINKSITYDAIKGVNEKEVLTDIKGGVITSSSVIGVNTSTIKEGVSNSSTLTGVKEIDIIKCVSNTGTITGVNTCKKDVKKIDITEGLNPSSSKESVNPSTSKESVNPITSKESVNPITGKESVNPITGKESVNQIDITKGVNSSTITDLNQINNKKNVDNSAIDRQITPSNIPPKLSVSDLIRLLSKKSVDPPFNNVGTSINNNENGVIAGMPPDISLRNLLYSVSNPNKEDELRYLSRFERDSVKKRLGRYYMGDNDIDEYPTGVNDKDINIRHFNYSGNNYEYLKGVNDMDSNIRPFNYSGNNYEYLKGVNDKDSNIRPFNYNGNNYEYLKNDKTEDDRDKEISNTGHIKDNNNKKLTYLKLSDLIRGINGREKGINVKNERSGGYNVANNNFMPENLKGNPNKDRVKSKVGVNYKGYREDSGGTRPVIDSRNTGGVNYKDYRDRKFSDNINPVIDSSNTGGVNYTDFRDRKFNIEKEDENTDNDKPEGCNEGDNKDECIKKEDGLEIGSALHIEEGNKDLEGDGIQFMLLSDIMKRKRSAF